MLRLLDNLLLNNLSQFSHPYILGFASLNNSIDSTYNVVRKFRRITSSLLTERLTCTERFMMSNDTINSARSCTSCCGDRFLSLSSQITISYSSSRFLVERPTWPVLPTEGINITRSEHFEKSVTDSKSPFDFRNPSLNLKKHKVNVQIWRT